jgi:type IV secretory pathway VirB10-like protein
MQSKDDPASTEIKQPQPIPQDKAAKRRRVLAILVAAILVALAAAAGGGYMLLHRYQPAPAQSTAVPVAGGTSQPETPAQNPAPTAAQATPPATEQKPAAGVAATRGSSPAAAPAQAAAPAPLPQPPTVAFNPRKLDPKKNTRLKFDLGHFPPSLAFTVEMDGKTFFKGRAASKADYDGLFVPPGVHRLRVEARSGAVQKISNIVTAEFIAKKHMTLKVELRHPANAKAAAADLDQAAQIVVSLKTDFFPF